MAFLQSILAKIGVGALKDLFGAIGRYLNGLKSKRKIKKKVNTQLESVLEAKNIIIAKQKKGEPVLEEDYDRLKKANSNFNYRR